MGSNNELTAGLDKPVGFWLRFCAGLADIGAIVAFVIALAEMAALLGWYIPIELAVIVTYAAYTAVSVAWKGTTVGKWLCGLEVRCRDGRKPGPVRSIIRAALTALFLFPFLGLPLLTIAARRSKRGWHDAISGTQVCFIENCHIRRRRAASVVCAVLIGWIAVQTGRGWHLYHTHASWGADAEAAIEKRIAHTSPLIEVSSLDESQRSEMAAWLSEHAQQAAEYIVDLAGQHQVTIVGEIHLKKQSLEFFNQIIPDLYHKAGVRTLALEYCCSDQDTRLKRLVNSKDFDRGLAADIARGTLWPIWGGKGYWDVLETVWELNRALPEGQERLQVVGICPRVDLVSFKALKDGPLVEKLRIIRLVLRDNLLLNFLPDAYYARNVERQAFGKDRRTVVWVGAAHTPLVPLQTALEGGRIWREYRMGSMLHGRYGGQVAQVRLHSESSQGGIARLIEECAKGNMQSSIAFAVRDSPFTDLKDSSEIVYLSDPNRRFVDAASAYIFLAPIDELDTCDWTDGYVSRRMFGRYKPFYESVCERELLNTQEANRLLPENFHNF